MRYERRWTTFEEFDQKTIFSRSFVIHEVVDNADYFLSCWCLQLQTYGLTNESAMSGIIMIKFDFKKFLPSYEAILNSLNRHTNNIPFCTILLTVPRVALCRSFRNSFLLSPNRFIPLHSHSNSDICPASLLSL